MAHEREHGRVQRRCARRDETTSRADLEKPTINGTKFACPGRCRRKTFTPPHRATDRSPTGGEHLQLVPIPLHLSSPPPESRILRRPRHAPRRPAGYYWHNGATIGPPFCANGASERRLVARSLLRAAYTHSAVWTRACTHATQVGRRRPHSIHPPTALRSARPRSVGPDGAGRPGTPDTKGPNVGMVSTGRRGITCMPRS